jgi:hypothetical protein
MSEGFRTGMQQGVSVLKEGSNIAAEKAGQMAEMGKIRYQIFLLEQKIEKNFSEMGTRLYDLLEARSKAPLSDGTIKKKVMEAKKLEKKIKVLQNKMGQLRRKVA